MAHHPVLLVIGNGAATAAISSVLMRCGCFVAVAADAATGFSLYKKIAASVSLVFCELLAPPGGGFSVFMSLQQMTPDIKVVMLMPDADKIAEDALLAVGVKEVLTAPFSAKQIEEVLMRQLKKDDRSPRSFGNEP